jgi:hypothetical protein
MPQKKSKSHVNRFELNATLTIGFLKTCHSRPIWNADTATDAHSVAAKAATEEIIRMAADINLVVLDTADQTLMMSIIMRKHKFQQISAPWRHTFSRLSILHPLSARSVILLNSVKIRTFWIYILVRISTCVLPRGSGGSGAIFPCLRGTFEFRRVICPPLSPPLYFTIPVLPDDTWSFVLS